MSKWKAPSIALGFLLLLSLLAQQLIVGYFEAQITREMKFRTSELADGLINGMNMLMITGQIGNPENRLLLLRKMADSKGVDELRIIRAKQVQDQFGPGLASEQEADPIDHDAITSKKPIYLIQKTAEGNRQFRAVIPFIASHNFRGTNCLSCHHVQEGSVNGAASILLNMDDADAKLAQVKRWVWAGNIMVVLMLIMLVIWRRADRRIQFLANYDSVTGLPNRNLLQEQLPETVRRARLYSKTAAILFIDLDDFKNVNDSLGHDIGDQLLRELAGRFTVCINDKDSVARLGGDEFVVILNEIAHANDTIPIAQCLLQSIAQPFHLAGRELFVSASIGIALYPQDGEDETTLLKNADSAMYHAKKRGKNGYQFYTADMNAQALERLSLVNDLHHALQRNEFDLHYQPQINLKSGKITGVEALLRWHHPTLGLVSPAKFIPLAEETRQIVPIGQWAIHTACRQAKEWHNMGFELTVAINFSALEIEEHSLIELVEEALSVSGMSAQYLEIELTESCLIQQPEAIYNIFQRLRKRGVRLSVDDFGTGYSSLSYIKRLPIDKLKIDQSFVQDVADDPDDLAIVEAIISMAHSLRLKAIAEGVETEGQAEILRRLNCDEMQGYLFSKPLVADQLTALLTSKA